MTPCELAAARQRLGLTQDQLAAELGVPPHAYRACEAGRATLPRRETEMLAYILASAERYAALPLAALAGAAGGDATAFAIISVALGAVLGWTLLRHLPRDRDGR